MSVKRTTSPSSRFEGGHSGSIWKPIEVAIGFVIAFFVLLIPLIVVSIFALFRLLRKKFDWLVDEAVWRLRH